MSYCGKCGVKQEEGAHFCYKCGSKVAPSASDSAGLKQGTTFRTESKPQKEEEFDRFEYAAAVYRGEPHSGEAKIDYLEKHKKALRLKVVVILSLVLILIVLFAPLFTIHETEGGHYLYLPYERFHSFSEGLAAAKIGGPREIRWGFIDQNFNEVIPPIYVSVSSFSEGLARVRSGRGVYSFIDKSGNEVISLESRGYSLVRSFSEGLALVGSGNYRIEEVVNGAIDKNGKEVIPVVHGTGRDRSVGTTGGFSEGLVAIEIDEMWGFLDRNGNEAIPFVYNLAQNFSEGLAAVKTDGRWGFIDQNGNEVIPPIYDFPSNIDRYFSEGFVAVRIDCGWGFIDRNGNEVIPLIYGYARRFSDGLAAVTIDGGWGFIDRSGNEVIPFVYDNARPFSEGLAAVEIDGKWGFINRNGDEVIPLIYDRVYDFSEGFALIQADDRWGFVDRDGSRIFPSSRIPRTRRISLFGKYIQPLFRSVTTRPYEGHRPLIGTYYYQGEYILGALTFDGDIVVTPIRVAVGIDDSRPHRFRPFFYQW